MGNGLLGSVYSSLAYNKLLGFLVTHPAPNREGCVWKGWKAAWFQNCEEKFNPSCPALKGFFWDKLEGRWIWIADEFKIMRPCLPSSNKGCKGRFQIETWCMEPLPLGLTQTSPYLRVDFEVSFPPQININYTGKGLGWRRCLLLGGHICVCSYCLPIWRPRI